MNGSGLSVEQTFVGGTRDKPKNVCIGGYGSTDRAQRGPYKTAEGLVSSLLHGTLG